MKVRDMPTTQSRYAHRNTPGYRIFWHRRRCRMSQRELGEIVGVRHNQIQRIEAGEALPSFPTAMRICRALNIDPGWVYDGKVTCKRDCYAEEQARDIERVTSVPRDTEGTE